MRNHRNCIPVPTKPVRNPPKPLPRKSCSCQTERVVLVKEENLSFHLSARPNQNDCGMRRDYVKAINYINSCHKFINAIIEKNMDNKSNVFLLPMVTNFIPIFPLLTGRKTKKEKVVAKPSYKQFKSDDRKSKSNFAVKKPVQEAPLDPVPVGDCVQDIQEDKYANQVADIVKGQIQQFLTTLQEDMNKAMRKTKSETPKQKCKNLDIVKQRLEELTKICFLQKNIEGNQHIVQTATRPPTPPPMNTSEDCSVILSDIDCEELKKPTQISQTSLVSESSDIKSDSDLEIHF